ncbi:MAG: hypothetical protein V8T10_09845 [Merdibacter sp.]
MTGWIAPMLIGAQQPAFDDPDFIYELKLDGIRCIASMCDGKLQLYNKRGQRLLSGSRNSMTLARRSKRTASWTENCMYSRTASPTSQRSRNA